MDIALTLKEMGFMDGFESPSPDLSSYAAMNSNWRDEETDPPTLQQMQTAWDALNLATVLNTRLNDVSKLFDQKFAVGYSFIDPQSNQQVFKPDDSGLRWLDRSALRARKSKDDEAQTPGRSRTFKMRTVAKRITLTDDELIDVASGLFDWGDDLDDTAQDLKDSLRDIAESIGTDAEKTSALNAYDITIGW